MDNNIFSTLLDKINRDYDEIDSIYSISKKLYQFLEKEFRSLDNEAKVAIEKSKYLKNKINSENVSSNSSDLFLSNGDKSKKRIELYEIENDLSKTIIIENDLIEKRNKIQKILDDTRLIASKSNLVSKRMKQNIEILKSLEVEDKPSNFNGIYTLEMMDIDRQRIAKDMHDSVAQSILSIVHRSELCFRLLDSDIQRVKLEIQNIQKVAKDTLNETREIIYDLNPISIGNVSLYDLVCNYVNNKKDGMSFVINLNETNAEQKIEMKPIVNITILRIIQEAFHNIEKHAQANMVDVNIIYDSKSMKVIICDNGIGFNAESIDIYHKSTQSYLSGYGLSIMKERAILLGGELDICSESGVGTTISVTVSIDQL